MARYAVETKLSPEEVIEKAEVYFGEGGLGLESTKMNPCCAYFEGGGGHVTVTASEGARRTSVELETREWDYHASHFLKEIT
jgi:hypothetical protein